MCADQYAELREEERALFQRQSVTLVELIWWDVRVAVFKIRKRLQL